MTIVHVTGVSTWGLYTKCTICMLWLVHEDYRTWRLYTKCMICMLQVWVHCDGIICTIACYGIITIIFLTVIVNIEYHIIVFIPRDSVFQIWIVSAAFSSSCFCWVTCSLILCISAVLGEFDWRICSSLTVRSQLWYESATWIWNLDLQLGPTYL